MSDRMADHGPAAQVTAEMAALSVWPTGQHDEASQLRDGGYVADTAADSERVMPAIAACAITAYSAPGEVVLDPDCGAGTVLVEALRAGRHTVGLTPNARWWSTARANVTAAKQRGAWRDGCVLDGYPQLLATVQAAGLTSHVGLVLTSLRPRNGDADPDHALTRLTRTLRHCRPLLRPGGHVIITLRPQRHAGALLDLPSRVLAAGQAAGLLPAARCVALLAGLRGSRLVTRASLAERRAAGTPTLLPVHHDVLVFRTLPALAEAAVVAGTPPPTIPRYFERHLSRRHVVELARTTVARAHHGETTGRNALGSQSTRLGRAA